MSFPSKYDKLIWNRLYTVKVPDIVTMDPNYIRVFGVHVSGDPDIDNILTNNLVEVRINIAKIAEYYDDGVQVNIPSRDDLIEIYKNIELYLNEWKDRMNMDLNLRVSEHKTFLLVLEKMSKDIYNRATSKELIGSVFMKKTVKMGIVNPLVKLQEEKEMMSRDKPDYDGIASLIKSKIATEPKRTR